MENKGKYYITTAIAYASGKPHIGNTYEIIMADSIARYKKMLGYDVYFQTGTDEHGQKIEELAKKENISPKKYADNISEIIKNMWKIMNCSYDLFIRTTDSHHVKAVQQIFNKLYEKGDIYKGSYEGWYCVPCESFWTDSQLVENKCPECNRDVKKTKETAYFLKVGKYQEKLLQHYEKNKNFIVPNFYADEIINNFLKPGLQDFCISRNTFKWGVPIDFDPDFVIYVWLDALINYITSLKFDLENPNENFKKFWPADLHVVGKDILRFHAIIWPIVLMMLDLPLPKQILTHQWLLYKDSKMSKSSGNVIYADDLVNFFSVDTIRFYVLKAMSLNHDGSISYDNIISTYNTDLANTIGNLVKRVCDMIYKYFDGIIPEINLNSESVLEKIALESFKNYYKFIENYDISEAISQILNFARECNKYIDQTTPWILAKDETKQELLKNILYDLAESIRFIAVMFLPIIPQTAEKILKQINCSNKDLNSLNEFRNLKSGTKIEKPEIIFNRMNQEEKIKEIEKYFNS